jgi:hypothetical protein
VRGANPAGSLHLQLPEEDQILRLQKSLLSLVAGARPNQGITDRQATLHMPLRVGQPMGGGDTLSFAKTPSGGQVVDLPDEILA